MSWLAAGLGGVALIGALVGALVWAARRWGAAAARAARAEEMADANDRALGAAVNAPSDTRGLVDRLRNGGF